MHIVILPSDIHKCHLLDNTWRNGGGTFECHRPPTSIPSALIMNENTCPLERPHTGDGNDALRNISFFSRGNGFDWHTPRLCTRCKLYMKSPHWAHLLGRIVQQLNKYTRSPHPHLVVFAFPPHTKVVTEAWKRHIQRSVTCTSLANNARHLASQIERSTTPQISVLRTRLLWLFLIAEISIKFVSRLSSRLPRHSSRAYYMPTISPWARHVSKPYAGNNTASILVHPMLDHHYSHPDIAVDIARICCRWFCHKWNNERE